jgi:hypothetical protein
MDDAGQTSSAAAAPLAAGSQAPDFTLHTTPDQTECHIAARPIVW